MNIETENKYLNSQFCIFICWTLTSFPGTIQWVTHSSWFGTCSLTSTRKADGDFECESVLEYINSGIIDMKYAVVSPCVRLFALPFGSPLNKYCTHGNYPLCWALCERRINNESECATFVDALRAGTVVGRKESKSFCFTVGTYTGISAWKCIYLEYSSSLF